jgi:hypothetical protein
LELAAVEDFDGEEEQDDGGEQDEQEPNHMVARTLRPRDLT